MMIGPCPSRTFSSLSCYEHLCACIDSCCAERQTLAAIDGDHALQLSKNSNKNDSAVKSREKQNIESSQLSQLAEEVHMHICRRKMWLDKGGMDASRSHITSVPFRNNFIIIILCHELWLRAELSWTNSAKWCEDVVVVLSFLCHFIYGTDIIYASLFYYHYTTNNY